MKTFFIVADVHSFYDEMIAALNEAPDAEPKQLLENVKGRIDDFVGDAPQFDDITMMCFAYKS